MHHILWKSSLKGYDNIENVMLRRRFRILIPSESIRLQTSCTKQNIE